MGAPFPDSTMYADPLFFCISRMASSSSLGRSLVAAFLTMISSVSCRMRLSILFLLGWIPWNLWEQGTWVHQIQTWGFGFWCCMWWAGSSAI